MCGRFTLFTEGEDRDIWEIIRDVNAKYGEGSIKTGEIFPTDAAPVLCSEGGAVVPKPMAWGFPGFNGKGVIINARSETASEKPMFKNSLFARRCVIPSTGFYEWTHSGEKKKYLFRLPGETALYMAGFYGLFDGAERFMILTAAANASMAEVHGRMPVVLEKDGIQSWLLDLPAALQILHGPIPMLAKTQA